MCKKTLSLKIFKLYCFVSCSEYWKGEGAITQAKD